MVRPLHPPWILGPTGEGYTQMGGQGSPLAKPCSASCFIPGPSPAAVTTLKVATGIWPASGDGPAQPFYLLLQGGYSYQCPFMGFPHLGEVSQQRYPSYSSGGSCSWKAGHLLDQAPLNLVVDPLSTSGGLSGWTLHWQSIPRSVLAHRVGTLVTS